MVQTALSGRRSHGTALNDMDKLIDPYLILEKLMTFWELGVQKLAVVFSASLQKHVNGCATLANILKRMGKMLLKCSLFHGSFNRKMARNTLY